MRQVKDVMNSSPCMTGRSKQQQRAEQLADAKDHQQLSTDDADVACVPLRRLRLCVACRLLSDGPCEIQSLTIWC